MHVAITPLSFCRQPGNGKPFYGFGGYYTRDELFYIYPLREGGWKTYAFAQLSERCGSDAFSAFEESGIIQTVFARRKDLVEALETFVQMECMPDS